MPGKYNLEVEAFLSFQKGDDAGFLYFYDIIYPGLSFFANNLLQDQPEAEDLADESFLKAWDQREKFTSPENLKAFLFHVTKNACVDVLRRRKTFLAIQKNLNYCSDKSTDAIDQEIFRAESLSQIYALIDILPPKCRQIFTLYYQEGRSYQEISEQLQLSINTVRVQRAKAIFLIKSKLDMGNLFFLLILTIVKFFP